MALPARGRRGFQDSKQNMAAARPRLAVVPSGARRAWGTADSAPSASSSFLDLRSSSVGPSAAAGQGSATAAKGKAPAVPQPNVKKMRRRVALLSGVHLNLPTSPVVGPSPPGSTREMAFTFTAEWDSAQDEIIFSEVESRSSSSTPSSTSSSSLRFIASPIPFDVGEDEIFDLDLPGAPPVAPSPPFSDMHASSSCSSPSSPSTLLSPFSPSMSAVSEIFDFYMHTPHKLSFAHHERNGSVSTAPSSPGPPSPAEQSPPPYPASRGNQPIISVTFYQEAENPARGAIPQVTQVSEVSESAIPALNAYSIEAATFSGKKPRALPPAPSARHVARRPLPPVPTRGAAMPDVSGVQQSSVWDDRVSRMPPRRLQSQRVVASPYSPPLAGPLHARAASLGNEAARRDAGAPSKGAALGKHFRSISAVLTGGLHRSH